MNVISIDASTTCIGWSIFDNDNLIAYGKLKPTIEKLEWRERIQNLIPQVQELINKYKPTEMYVEDVPLIAQKAKKTLVQLGAVQGSLIGICGANNIKMNFITVGMWRHNIGISTGDKDRDSMKVKSLHKANELFDLDLACVFTKGGNYNGDKSDDDIADSINLYASTRKKYQVPIKHFGKRRTGGEA